MILFEVNRYFYFVSVEYSINYEDDEESVDDIYEVEKIVSHRVRKSGNILKILWRGWEQPTEEKESEMRKYIPTMIDEYYAAKNKKREKKSCKKKLHHKTY